MPNFSPQVDSFDLRSALHHAGSFTARLGHNSSVPENVISIFDLTWHF